MDIKTITDDTERAEVEAHLRSLEAAQTAYIVALCSAVGRHPDARSHRDPLTEYLADNLAVVLDEITDAKALLKNYEQDRPTDAASDRADYHQRTI
jgi:hypothetical protein